MLSTTSVAVYLDSPEAIMYGGPREANTTAVTGRVVVTGKNAAQVTSLTVVLRAQRARMFQTQQSAAPATRVQATLVADGQPQVEHAAVSERAHAWRFELGVPGELAETVYTRSSFVAYEVVAEARALGAFAAVQSRAAQVAIKRTPPADSVWTATASAAVNETATWRAQLELTLAAPSRIVHDTQGLGVTCVMRPLAKGLRLRRVAFQLAERITHSGAWHAQPYTATSVVAEEAICVAETDGPGEPLVHETAAVRTVNVPCAYTGVQYDIHRGAIRAHHELVLAVSITDAQDRVHNLRLATALFVLPRAQTRRPSLPRYEDAGADRLVSAPAPRRDSDFWAQFVLVDTVPSPAPTPASAPLEPALDACPLALHGYRPCDIAQTPPPSYPGTRDEIERTVVPPLRPGSNHEIDTDGVSFLRAGSSGEGTLSLYSESLYSGPRPEIEHSAMASDAFVVV
ncbi:hypothetical protein IWW50_005837 [Coemansia erecta]|nr:hypothetical protein IWW50_005837 [Coemansia erecta]